MARATIGRIVHYRFDDKARAGQTVAVAEVSAGDYYPALVVKTYPDYEERIQRVDLQVFYGPGTVWVTDVPQGDEHGCWQWPPRS